MHVHVQEKIVQHASASSCEFIVGPNAFAVLMKNVARVLGESALPLHTDDVINRKQKFFFSEKNFTLQGSEAASSGKAPVKAVTDSL